MRNIQSTTPSLLIALTSILIFMINFSYADDLNYQRLKLKEGISIEVPKHWHKHTEIEKMNFAASSEASSKIAKSEYDEKNDKIRILAVSSLPIPSAAKIRLNVLRPVVMTSDYLVSLTAQDLKDTQIELSAVMAKSMSEVGSKLLSLETPRIESINGKPTFCFDYRRTDLRVPNPWVVRICQISVGNKTIEFTTSYRETEGVVYKVILDYVKQSLHFN